MLVRSDPRPLVSLVVSALNEAENIPGLLDLVRSARGEFADVDFELVFVDDGSTDGTADRLRSLLRPDDAAVVVSFSRNFGSHVGISAALAHARGDCALTLSADLQEPLEAIGRFVAEWRGGADVVWGVRRSRAVSRGVGHALSEAFSRWFHRYSIVPTYPRQGPSQVLLSRPVIDVLVAMPERNRNVFAMAAWTGFEQRTIEFEQLPRPAGRSKWTNSKKVKLVLDSFVGFSNAPMRAAIYVGTLLAALGVLLALAAIVLGLVPSTGMPPWMPATALVAIVGGMILGFLGLLGEYLWRAGDDARQRPLYVVRSVHAQRGTVQDGAPLGGTGETAAA
jgi:dolichol-phosphate mannosyltransferase